MHGAPVGAKRRAGMEERAFFSKVEGAGAFGEVEQLAGAEEFVFSEKGAFRA